MSGDTTPWQTATLTLTGLVWHQTTTFRCGTLGATPLTAHVLPCVTCLLISLIVCVRSSKAQKNNSAVPEILPWFRFCVILFGRKPQESQPHLLTFYLEVHSPFVHIRIGYYISGRIDVWQLHARDGPWDAVGNKVNRLLCKAAPRRGINSWRARSAYVYILCCLWGCPVCRQQGVLLYNTAFVHVYLWKFASLCLHTSLDTPCRDHPINSTWDTLPGF